MSDSYRYLFSWPIAWAASFLLVTIAFFYLRGWLRLRNSFPNVIPPWRLAALIGGLLSVWTAAISPIAMLDHRSLAIHMVKHLLLMTIAAPLVLSAKPVLPLLYGISRRGVGSDILLGNRSAKWLERSFAHPWLCWLAASTVLIGWHIPVAFQLAQRFEWIHGIEDASFFLAGLLFWWPVIPALPSAERSPRWSMALYLFLATLPCDVLSAFLAFCNRLVYPGYLTEKHLFGMSPLQDQECAGALMWVWATFAYLIPAVIIAMQILSPDGRSHRPVQSSPNGLAARSLNGSEPEVL